MVPCLRTSSGRQAAGRSDDGATIGTAGWTEGPSSLVRLSRRATKRRAKRSPKLGCAPCCELAAELPAAPFSRSRGRLRGEGLYENMGLPKENRRSVGESGEKRERSKEGSGSGEGTPIDGCSLVLEEARVL